MSYNPYKPGIPNPLLILKQRPVLYWLILINAAVWLFENIFNLFLFLFKIEPDNSWFSALFAVPADIQGLLHKPWTIITYMFIHADFSHLFFNMLMLYFGGLLMSQFMKASKIVTFYFWGGIWGAILYITAYNIFPVFGDVKDISVALGASAAVLSVLVGIATYMPEYRVQLLLIGPVRLKYIALGLVIIDILSISKGNPGGHIAHLGGALYGYLAIKHPLNLWKGLTFEKISFALSNLIKPKLKVHYKAEGQTHKRPVSDDDYNKMRVEKQKRIDSILDKISKNGYDSLTREEKDFLFKSGNKN